MTIKELIQSIRLAQNQFNIITKLQQNLILTLLKFVAIKKTYTEKLTINSTYKTLVYYMGE